MRIQTYRTLPAKDSFVPSPSRMGSAAVSGSQRPAQKGVDWRLVMVSNGYITIANDS